jgi:DNA-binding CsgD family transcriptional regulator
LGTHFLTPFARSTLAVVALRRGEVQAAANHVTMLHAGPRQRLGSGAVVCDWVDGLVREAREGPERAVDLLGSVYDGAPGSTRLFVEEPGAASWLVRVALRVGELSSAAAVAGAAARLATGNPSIGPLVAAGHHARGLVDQDADLLQRSAAEYASPWDRASAHEDAATALFARSENDAGRSVLSDAVAEYECIGAVRDATRTRARQRAAGRHCAGRDARERATCGWESLTDTDLRVAERVAQGLTNRAVAESMYLSPHTIDFHLRQAFRKLGVSSRVELTRLVLERQIGGVARAGVAGA